MVGTGEIKYWGGPKLALLPGSVILSYQGMQEENLDQISPGPPGWGLMQRVSSSFVTKKQEMLKNQTWSLGNQSEIDGWSWETGLWNLVLLLVLLLLLFERLRWSRCSVLTFSTQVRGFKPGRSRQISKGEKILSTPSFGGEVKPSVPCRRFAACKRSLNGVEVVISAKKLPDNILAHSSHFRRWDLSRRGGRGGTWWWKVGISKKKRGKAMASYP